MSGSGKERSLARQGAIAGAKGAFVLSLVYAMLVTEVLVLGSTSPSVSDLHQLVTDFLGALLLGLLFGVPAGVVPSVILGAITGWSTGKILMQQPSLSRDGTVRLALRVCLAFALSINLFALALLWVGSRPTQLDAFLTYIGLLAVPSVIYVLAGVWMSGRWYRLQFGEES